MWLSRQQVTLRLLVGIFGTSFLLSFNNKISSLLARHLRLTYKADPDSFYAQQSLLAYNHFHPDLPYSLPAAAVEWCVEPTEPTWDYRNCSDETIVNVLPLQGGLSNSLKMIILGALASFEEGRCFTIEERGSPLIERIQHNETPTPFLERYFEPMGLTRQDPLVEAAMDAGDIEIKDWRKVWNDRPAYRNRRRRDMNYTMESLGFKVPIDGHRLKREFLKRFWRLLPDFRQEVCRALALDHGLHHDFVVFSVRRGDKERDLEEGFPHMMQYINALHGVVENRFWGTMPRIFVATDDCAVLDELRTIRPTWNFVSECDFVDEQQFNQGFDLNNMKDWTLFETDRHFRKFFVELYAMAIAKYFIGVQYTNVSWLAYFLRHQQSPDSFHILDAKGEKAPEESMDLW